MKNIFALTLIFYTSLTLAFQITDDFEPGNVPSNFWAGDYTGMRTDDLSNGGDYSLKFAYPGVPDGEYGFQELRFFLPEKVSEFTMEYDLYVPSNYYHRTQTSTSSNNKGLFQMWSGQYGGVASNVFVGIEHWPTGNGSSNPSIRLGYNHIDLGHIHPNKMDFGTKIISIPEDLGKWIHYKSHVKLSDEGSKNGIVEIWKDENLIVKKENIGNYSEAGNYFDKGYLLGWANSGFTENTTLYIDNFSIVSQSNEVKSPPGMPKSIEVKT